MKIGALVLAAGSGMRFDSSLPKQFHELHGKKIYRYPLDVLLSSNIFCSIGVVSKSAYYSHLHPSDQSIFIEGGNSRQESVFLGLKALNNIDFVMICDGVRPFLTLQMINAHIEKLSLGFDAVNTCISSADTINIKYNSTIKSIPPRNSFLRGQTPQSFCYKKLLKAHQSTSKFFTDDCALMLEYGHSVTYIEGNEKNIKITSSLDLDIASAIYKKGLSFTC